MVLNRVCYIAQASLKFSILLPQNPYYAQESLELSLQRTHVFHQWLEQKVQEFKARLGLQEILS